jgi:uncharacterized protein (TIGR02246 family)
MATIEQEFASLERRYWDAVQHRDGETAAKLTDDPCVVVGAQGVGMVDRARISEMLTKATFELTKFDFDDASFKVRKLTDDVVIVAYQVHEDVVVDNKPESLAAHDASVWVRRGDQWLCALHTESLKGDPFGRRDIDRLA